MATASSNGNAPTLTEKLRDRHVATVQQFQKTVREACQQFDVDALNALTDLRTALSVSRAHSEELMDASEARVNAGRESLDTEAAAFAHRQVGDAVSLLVDYFHVDGVNSPQTREERIAAERAAILQMYVQLRVLHGERMVQLEQTNAALVNLETSRRQTLRLLMETLMHDLSKVAHVGVTDCHVLVQRAIASVNEQLITNQRTCKTLISQLKQHELLKQRDYAERTAMLFGALLRLAQDSSTLWTQQLLASKSFRDPRSRTSMLKRIQAASAATKGEVTHALHGMQSLTETLKRYRTPSHMLELCGGTEPNGWLRFFNDDIFKPIFAQSPAIVADEWRVFLEVILHNAQCSVVTLSEDTDTIEGQLIAEMARMCDVLAQTIEFIYTPRDEEAEWVRQGSLDGENLYPFQNFVHPDTNSMEEGKRAAAEALQPLCTEVQEESSWFKKTVAQSLETHKSSLDDVLVRAPGNVTSTFKDTTAALTTAAETPQQHVRTFFVTQYEAEKDYVDQLSWLERDVADITSRLEHAGTIDTAKALCIEGMHKLDDIERLYVRYHKQRVGPMPSATTDAEALLDKESKALYAKLNVVPRVLPGATTDAPVSLETSLKGGNSSKRATSKLSASMLQQAPTALSVTVLEPGQQVITLSDGSELVVMGPMKYGMDVPPVPKPEELTSPTTATATTPRAGAEKPPAKAPAPKGKKPTAADAEAEAAELAAAQAAAALSAQPSPTLAWFMARLEPILSDVFCEGCLFSEGSVTTFKNSMRENMLEWVLQLRIRVMHSVRTYCDDNKKALDRQMNECIRRHQRRPPTLQAQIYETRLRELHDGNVSREKYFEWLTSRVATLASNASTHQQKCTDEFQRDTDKLKEIVSNVSTMMSAAALDSHGRSVHDGARRALLKVQQREEEGKKQIQHMITTILQECTSFKNERLKSFEEGGSMAKEETQAAAESIARTIADGEAAAARAVKDLETLSAAQAASLEALKASYSDAKAHNSDELAFFVRIQEVFAQLKGRVSNLISTSTNTQRNIDELLHELEELITSAPRTDASTLEKKYLSTDYPASFRELRRDITDVETSAPESWQGYNEVLSSRLIGTHLNASSLVRQSLPNKLMMVVDKLRMALYLRGLFLGCLAHNVEYVAVAPDAFLEPPRVAATGVAAGTTSVDPAGGKKGAASPKGAKGAGGNSNAKGGEAAAAAAAAPSSTPAVPVVIKAEVEVSKWAASCQADFSATAQKYFQSRPPPLLRPQVLNGATLDDVQLTASTRIAEQQEKSATHIGDATKRYREQVQRLFIALHNCGAVLCNGLFNLSVSSLTMRLDDIFRVFNKYYAEMLNAKAENSSLIKGSLALPANRPQLVALDATESTRQVECKQMLQAFEQICLRELQDEASRVSSRVCHSTATLFTMLRGVVTPEHIVPGEGVVLGEHKSLKKLMRQKQREDAAKLLEATAAPAVGGKGAAAAAAATAKKPEPKKAAEKPSGKGGKGGKGDVAQAGTKQEDEDAAAGLLPLERAVTDYPGIITNAVRVYLRFRADHPSLDQPPNHYVRPAQWEAERLAAKQQQELEQQAAAEQSKKPASKAAAAAKPAAKASSPTSAGGPPGTPSTPLIDDEVSVALTAPRDRLHQQTALLRQNSVEAFTLLCSKMGLESQRTFEAMLKLENGWNASWSETIDSLCTEKNQPPKAPPRQV